MTYLVSALLALAGLLAFLWQRARREVDELRAARKFWHDAAVADEETIERLEEVVREHRKKADRLIEELARCDDGAAVDLARRVLLDPAGDGAGAVPDDASADVGGRDQSGAW